MLTCRLVLGSHEVIRLHQRLIVEFGRRMIARTTKFSTSHLADNSSGSLSFDNYRSRAKPIQYC